MTGLLEQPWCTRRSDDSGVGVRVWVLRCHGQAAAHCAIGRACKAADVLGGGHGAGGWDRSKLDLLRLELCSLRSSQLAKQELLAAGILWSTCFV